MTQVLTIVLNGKKEAIMKMRMDKKNHLKRAISDDLGTENEGIWGFLC